MVRPDINSKSFAFLLMTIIMVVTSCSTKKNTFSRRVYHNLTAHYNAYWNGKESLKEGQYELLNLVADNYTFILPMFNYGSKEGAISINPYMDRAIEKGTMVIQRHSMEFNGKEYVRWIDDAYLMIGKAYFYKHEYNMARRTFDYVIKHYSDDPIKFNAMVWLANTYIQQKEWEKAQSLLDLVQSKIGKEQVPNSARKHLPLVYADYYIKQGLYRESITHLERGIEINTDKYLKTRAMFILGQIYQFNNDYEAATEYYTYVIKKNPPYEMAFNAKINLAQSFDIETGDRKLIIKKLEKMLKDEKNDEFQDQIYYALAEIAIREGNDSLAIDYYRLSVSKSISNNYQKAVSSLKLADLYYSYPDYVNAQAYYDSAMMFLPEDFPDYDILESKTETLTSLVNNILIVREQDSLQNLANMSEAERDEIIGKLIEEYKEEEKRRKEEERAAQQNQMMAAQSYQNKQNINRLAGGKWYFYNPSTLSYGYTEFIKRWGNRKLEDLWRLKNKKMMSFDYEEEIIASADSVVSDSIKSLETDPSKKEYYLQGLPLTDEAMALSDSLIRESLYKMGYIYKIGINDYPRSIETFDELNERYPGNSHKLESYYHLFRIYDETGNTDKAGYYKDQIITNYPDSDYAKILIDPNYNLVLQAQHNKASLLYEETYEAYKNQQYQMVQIYSEEAFESYQEDQDLIPRFEYLYALAIGKTDGHDSLLVHLRDVVTRYPSHDVAPLAQNIIDLLTGKKQMRPAGDTTITFAEVTPEDENIEEISPYSFEPDVVHFYVLIINAMKVNVNATKVKISDHNIKYHRLNNLSISSVLLDAERQMITVSNFKNKQDALAYYSGIKASEYVFSSINKDDFEHFVVSAENYKIFYQNKDAEQYQRFFAKNYLNPEK